MSDDHWRMSAVEAVTRLKKRERKLGDGAKERPVRPNRPEARMRADQDVVLHAKIGEDPPMLKGASE